MKDVLALVVSPRKLGNCEIMAKAIEKKIPEPHTTRLLRLHDFTIKPCIGCYRCLFKERRCILDDDLSHILEAMAAADAWIVVAPTYFLGVNALLKLLLDRGLSFYGRGDRLWMKPAIGVGIAGIPGKEGATLLGLENFLQLTMSTIKAVRMVYGALPGEVLLNDENRQLAAQLGGQLLAPAPKSLPHSCPVCGGTTFRFETAAHVRCMVCSNAGPAEATPQGMVFKIQPSPREIFGTLETVREHEEWLLKMKQRFLDKKKELKAVGHDYRKGWTWVKPFKEGTT